MAASNQDIQCVICANHLDPSDFVASDHQCPHQHTRVCKSCWENYLKEEIADMARWSTDIPCMLCGQNLIPQDIRDLATKETYDRYMDLAFLHNIRKDPDFRECPSADCLYGHLQSSENSTTFYCERCEIEYCINCGVTMHQNETCEEYQARTRAHAVRHGDATNVYLAKNTKACPNPECGIQVEKRDGCNLMTCNSCKHRFCWLCLASFRRGPNRHPAESIHHETCPDHYQNLQRQLRIHDPSGIRTPFASPPDAPSQQDPQMTPRPYRSGRGSLSLGRRHSRTNDGATMRLRGWPPSRSVVASFERHNRHQSSHNSQWPGTPTRRPPPPREQEHPRSGSTPLIVVAAVALALVSVSWFRRNSNA